MEKGKLLIYEAPLMEIIEVKVENGFVASGNDGFGGEGSDVTNGTWE